MFEQVGASAGPNWKFWLILATVLVALLLSVIWVLRMILMPLRSFTGELASLSAEQTETSKRLSEHVQYLSETIGERNLSRAGTLEAAADYIRSSLEQAGYSVTAQSYSVRSDRLLPTYPTDSVESSE